jgi:hypothetical protein
VASRSSSDESWRPSTSSTCNSSRSSSRICSIWCRSLSNNLSFSISSLSLSLSKERNVLASDFKANPPESVCIFVVFVPFSTILCQETSKFLPRQLCLCFTFFPFLFLLERKEMCNTYKDPRMTCLKKEIYERHTKIVYITCLERKIPGKSTSSRFPTIFLIFREQNYFLLLYKKISHNRFPYFSLYQLNIIFLLLFYSFSLFPTFSLFPISINYTSFILK